MLGIVCKAILFFSLRVYPAHLCFLSCSQTRARGVENSILQSREGYRPIARRAAVMFDVARSMAEINTAYQTSLAQFLIVFDAAIIHSER